MLCNVSNVGEEVVVIRNGWTPRKEVVVLLLGVTLTIFHASSGMEPHWSKLILYTMSFTNSFVIVVPKCCIGLFRKFRVVDIF